MADGTQFQIDIAAKALGVEAAAAAVDRLASQLTAAETAATSAAEALSAGEAAFRSNETAADGASKAVERIGVKLGEMQNKMAAAVKAGDADKFAKLSAATGELEKRMQEATAKSVAARGALASQAVVVDKLRAADKSAADEVGRLSKAQEQATKVADAAKKHADALAKSQKAAASSGDFGDVTKGLKKLGGPVGNLANVAEDAFEGMESLSSSVGTFGAAAAGVTVVVVALAAALAAGVTAIAAWAVKLADAARTQQLLAAGIMQSTQAGLGLNEQIDNLSRSVPLSRDELFNMAADLRKTGLQGHALGDALESAAVKAAKAKFGPDWQKQMLSIGEQSKRIQSLFAKIFGGLFIDKFLEKLSSLIDLFDDSNASGRAIKAVFESIFQPLINGATDMIPKIRSAFIQFEILVLKTLIAIKPFGSEILFVAKVAGVLALVVIGALAAAIAVGVAIAIAFWTIIISIGNALQGATEAVVGFVTKIYEYFANTSLSQIGIDLIMGLVGGITGAGPAVLQALGGVVTGAIDSAKKLLGIASPSKVFADIGMQTAAGMAGGVESGTSTVQGSLENLVAPPQAQASTSGGSGSGGNFSGATFIFNGVQGAEDALARFEELLTRASEGDAAQLGAMAPG